MLYLNESHIRSVKLRWENIISEIDSAIDLLKLGSYAQPLKLYLRYKDPRNRIIAMPAYVGGEANTAGLKWIASFPDNIHTGNARANSIIVLNDSDTGCPYSIINSASVSAIRTAGVSACLLQKYIENSTKPEQVYTVGIVGLGPIGVFHLNMLNELFSRSISKILLYDISSEKSDRIAGEQRRVKTAACDSFEYLYQNADILITCTVSDKRYIDMPPRKGCFYLNISLRDFSPSFLKNVDCILVDDWDEVCRENTDIEQAHKINGLEKKDVFDLRQVDDLFLQPQVYSGSLMFNPMGMAVFDLVIGKYYYKLARAQNLGMQLD